MEVKKHENLQKGVKHYQKAEKTLGVEGQGMESVKKVMNEKVEATQDYHNEHNKGALNKVKNVVGLVSGARAVTHIVQDGLGTALKDLGRSSGDGDGQKGRQEANTKVQNIESKKGMDKILEQAQKIGQSNLSNASPNNSSQRSAVSTPKQSNKNEQTTRL